MCYKSMTPYENASYRCWRGKVGEKFFCRWIGNQHPSELVFTGRRRHDGVEFKVEAIHQTVSEATQVDGLNELVSDANRSNYDILVVRWSGLEVKPVATNGF